MKLYYSPGTCSLSPHIVAKESNLPLALEKVDLDTGKTEKGVDLAKVTPKAYVPALELDDGSILTEGAVIVQYLADKAPQSKLLAAAGTTERLRTQEWLNYIATEIHKSLGTLFAPLSNDVKAALRTLIPPKLAFLDESLKGKTFLLGEQFTVADAYLFTVLSWAKYVEVELPKGLKDYSARVSKRPAVQAALKAEGLL